LIQQFAAGMRRVFFPLFFQKPQTEFPEVFHFMTFTKSGSVGPPSKSSKRFGWFVISLEFSSVSG
jgi:hypothetical protein